VLFQVTSRLNATVCLFTCTVQMSDTPKSLHKTSTALKKAEKFAADANTRGVRVQAKQAVLHELNSQLRKHSNKIRLNREEEEHSTNEFTYSDIDHSKLVFYVCGQRDGSCI